jgi:hypothetical protein
MTFLPQAFRYKNKLNQRAYVSARVVVHFHYLVEKIALKGRGLRTKLRRGEVFGPFATHNPTRG